jgi:hypothetical protein
MSKRVVDGRGENAVAVAVADRDNERCGGLREDGERPIHKSMTLLLLTTHEIARVEFVLW